MPPHITTDLAASTNDDLEAPDKHAGVYITYVTHPEGKKITVYSRPIPLLSHASHYDSMKSYFYPYKGLLENKTTIPKCWQGKN